MSASGLSVLRPTTVGFPRSDVDRNKSMIRKPLLVKSSTNVDIGTSSSRASGSHLSTLQSDPSLTIIDVEARLREKVRQKIHELQQAFQTYDAEQTMSVTRGEFRRVLDMYCLALTTQQFDAVMAKVTTNPNGTVRYVEFLEKFYGHPPGVSTHENIVSKTKKNKSPSQEKVEKAENDIDLIIAMLRDKLKKNLKNVVKGFHLFDYNRDGRIQRHELRRLLENYCFKLSDHQFDRIWTRFNVRHNELLDYEEFLLKLGVKALTAHQYSGGDEVKHRSDNRKFIAQSPPSTGLNNLNLHEVERTFRQKMRENYTNLRRAFMVVDADGSGFVSIRDLRSVLSSFTFPMDEQLFMYFMETNAFKASGKIAWESFLEKFQDPQSIGNGQTLTTGERNHKFFPIRGAQETRTVEQIRQLLWNRVQDRGSFRKAFLQMDKNRSGKISRRELRRVIDQFKFPVSDEQFRDLLIVLDPSHSNLIDYHHFLELFEFKESDESHKWLTSVHKYNDKEKPIVLAWATVEDLLREKLTRNWKDIAEGLISADRRDEGLINPLHLKKILDKHCLPTTFEHFESLVDRCTKKEDGRIEYSEFFSRLGVDLLPGDTSGLSQQIQESNEQTEKKRKDSLQKSMTQFDQNTCERTRLMSASEIVSRLHDRARQHSTGIRNAFRTYDKKNRGKISKADFRRILTSMGFTLSDEQFLAVVDLLDFRDGYLNYRGFVEVFDDPREFGVNETITRSGNHHVNPIRGDWRSFTADEVEERLHRKLLAGFTRLRDAFFKFDDDHTGFLTKTNFRTMLDSFMLNMSDEEFHRLCERMEITEKSRMGYKDFLKKFEVLDSAEGHHWISDHRYNETLPDKVLTADQAHELLVQKAHRQYSDLAKAFRSIDEDGNGVITRFELRGLLYKFVIPTSKEEFAKLWKRYDPHGKGAISHEAFLEKLGAETFAPGDRFGESRRILDTNTQAINDHCEKMDTNHQLIAMRQLQRGQVMDTEELYNLLRLRIHDYHKDFYSVFRKYDKKKRGFLSVNEFQKVLNELNIYIRDDQFLDLMDRIGLVTNKSKLSYEDFLKAFEEGRKSAYGQRRPVVRIESNGDLPNLEAESKLREKVTQNGEVLIKAFVALDPEGTNRVKASVFRRILDNFCFKLSDAQFKYMMSKIRVDGDDAVDYKTFIEQTRNTTEYDGLDWLENVQRTVRARTPHLMQVEEIQDRLKEIVKARVYTFARVFAEIDYAKIGVISKEDFQHVLHQHAFRLTDPQFDRLWSLLPVNEFGNLEYKEFLNDYSSDDYEEYRGHGRGSSPDRLVLVDRDLRDRQPTRRSETPARTAQRPGTPVRGRPVSRRPHTQAGFRTATTTYSRRPLSAGGTPSRMLCRSRWAPNQTMPLINAESLERSLAQVVYKNWQDIQKQCRSRDTEGGGYISEKDLRDILSRHVCLNEEDYGQLMVKYDVTGNGMFAYMPFLRHFVLTMRSNQDGHRQKYRHRLAEVAERAKDDIEMSPLEEAMARLSDCIGERWKEMRRAFRHLDPQNRGHVTSVNFHQVLKQFTPNISEDEYFFILSNLDSELNDLVPYNEFVREIISVRKK